jgi:hypothetical protein
MAEPHVIFEPQQIGDEWQIRAHCPGAVLEYVTGFKSEQDAKDWIANPAMTKRWLRKRGYSK